MSNVFSLLRKVTEKAPFGICVKSCELSNELKLTKSHDYKTHLDSAHCETEGRIQQTLQLKTSDRIRSSSLAATSPTEPNETFVSHETAKPCASVSDAAAGDKA